MAKKRVMPDNMVEEIMETTKKVAEEAEMIDAQRKSVNEAASAVHHTQQVHVDSMLNTSAYFASLEEKEEPRSKRFQAVMKPSVHARLQARVDSKEIKSINDVLNYLLEEFLDKQGW